MIDLFILIVIFSFIYLIQQRRGEVNGQKCPFFLPICSERGEGGLYLSVFVYIFIYIFRRKQKNAVRMRVSEQFICIFRRISRHIQGHIQSYLGLYLHILGYISFLPYSIFSLPPSLRSVGREAIPSPASRVCVLAHLRSHELIVPSGL